MKISSHLSSARSFRRLATRGFSLTEMIIVLAVFLLLVLATVSAQIFGLRMYRISEAKLSTTAEARNALNRVRDEIRSGRVLFVGNGDGAGFSTVAGQQPRVGNALKICPTTDTNAFVYYYVDPINRRLNRKENGVVQVIARQFTNAAVFRVEDYLGNVATNDDNNRVIRVALQFYKKEYPLVSATQPAMYDYYQLETRIARRTYE